MTRPASFDAQLNAVTGWLTEWQLEFLWRSFGHLWEQPFTVTMHDD